FRLGMTWVLLAATSLLGGGGPAGTQGSPVGPPNTTDAYALLALSKMHVSGSISLLTGSLGVNEKEGELNVDGAVPVQLNTGDGVIASHKASLLEPSMCTSAAFFANTITGGSSDLCGAVQSQGIPEGQPPLVADVESSPVCDLPADISKFPKCDESEPITVNPASQPTTLRSGTYGALTINGGTLELLGGEYVFCNVTTNNGSQVIAAAPSTLLVADSFDANPNSQINVDGSPQDLRVLVNGKDDGQHDAVNIAGGTQLTLTFSGQPAAGRPVPLATTTCSFKQTPPTRQFGVNPTTTVVAQLCALGKPATLNLFSANILGTFIADQINVADIHAANGVPTTTS